MVRTNAVSDSPASRAAGAPDAARRRAAFLADLGALLDVSFDYERTLRSVARLAVRGLADWCFADVLEEDRSIRRVVLAHADPRRAPAAAKLKRLGAGTLDGTHPSAEVIRSGRPLLIENLPPRWFRSIATSRRHLDVLRTLPRPRSLMVVPLPARGKIIGALGLVSERAERLYGRPDLSFAQGIARRAGLAVDNARLYRALERANDLKSRLLSTAGHDLRAPLQAAMSQIRLLLARESGPLSPGQDEALRRVQFALEEQHHLVENLLDLAQLDGERRALRKRTLDLGELVRRMAEEFGPFARLSGLALEASPGPAPLQGDAMLLRRVLCNLLHNALKFTPAPGRIQMRLERKAGKLRLSVVDTGVGIKKGSAEAVFMRSARPARDGTGHRGLGLGLPICREIIEAHGGRIWAESRGPGRGSAFRVELPAFNPPASRRSS